jgi:hypothetical protein
MLFDNSPSSEELIASLRRLVIGSKRYKYFLYDKAEMRNDMLQLHLKRQIKYFNDGNPSNNLSIIIECTRNALKQKSSDGCMFLISDRIVRKELLLQCRYADKAIEKGSGARDIPSSPKNNLDDVTNF